MSEDVKNDILKAMQDAKIGNSNTNEKVVFPDPVILKHSLNEDGIIFPPPSFRQDGKGKS